RRRGKCPLEAPNVDFAFVDRHALFDADTDYIVPVDKQPFRDLLGRRPTCTLSRTSSPPFFERGGHEIDFDAMKVFERARYAQCRLGRLFVIRQPRERFGRMGERAKVVVPRSRFKPLSDYEFRVLAGVDAWHELL